MNIEEYINEKLWPILTEVVHALVMYPTHKAYIRDEILKGRPNTTPEELTFRLRIPLGEAIVILYELQPKSMIISNDVTAVAKSSNGLKPKNTT